jgi:hypothetical protein
MIAELSLISTSSAQADDTKKREETDADGNRQQDGGAGA